MKPFDPSISLRTGFAQGRLRAIQDGAVTGAGLPDSTPFHPGYRAYEGRGNPRTHGILRHPYSFCDRI
jgi:hypothetical protein